MKKSQKILVRLYLQEAKDSDLIDRLDVLPTYMRNDLIKDSLRYYIAKFVDKDKDENFHKTKATGNKTRSEKFVDPIGKTKNISFNL